MPLETVEVRWFGAGALAPGQWEWFASLHGSEHLRSEERTDAYVVLPGVSDLGIKWRGEESFDVKARRATMEDVRVPTGERSALVGSAEEWIKWTYPLAGNEGLKRVVSALPTIVVAKTRKQYLFDVSESALPWASPVRRPRDGEFPRVEIGLFLELAAVRCGHRDYWSLGIESSAALGPRLGDALRQVLAELPAGPLALDGARSLGYPGWLSSIASPDGL